MKILAVNIERNPVTDQLQEVASHGVDLLTGLIFPVKQGDPRNLGARFDRELNEWVLPEDKDIDP